MDMYDDGPEKQGHDESNTETAVLPKSILMGKKFEPGEEVVLQVVAVHGDSVEVKYASEPDKDEQPQEGGQPPDVGNPEPMGSQASGGGGDLYS